MPNVRGDAGAEVACRLRRPAGTYVAGVVCSEIGAAGFGEGLGGGFFGYDLTQRRDVDSVLSAEPMERRNQMARTAEAERTDGDEKATGPQKRTRSRGTRSAAKNPKENGRSRRSRGEMSNEHKQALAEGREQSRVVSRYLDALEEHKPKRGRKVTKESLEQKLQRVRDEIPTASAGERLLLFQEEMDLLDRLERVGEEFDMTALEAEFVKVAKSYAERRKLSRKAFAKMGVPTEVLKKAGIDR